MGLTTTSRGGTCRLGDNPNICAFPSICGDEGDGSETESEGPTATSSRVISSTLTSPGCARTYESDKDGEGGVVCKDVYVEVFVVPVFIVRDVCSIGFGNAADIVGAKAGSCKELDGSTICIDSTDVNLHVVAVVDEVQTFNQLLDVSFSLDVEHGSIS